MEKHILKRLSLPIISMVAKLTITEKLQQDLNEEPKLKSKEN